MTGQVSIGFIVVRTCLSTLGGNLSASDPKGVLREGPYKYVNFVSADSYGAFADIQPPAVIGIAQLTELFRADLLD